jgi:toluene monooxygenase system protein B
MSMAAFPIPGRFVGDFVPHLVAVDTEDSIEEVGRKIAAVSIGRRIARPAQDHGFEVLIGEDLLPADALFGAVLAERGLRPLAWVDARFREPTDA